MDRIATQMILWQARRALLGLGWPGAAAISLAAFAATFCLSTVLPLQVRTEALRDRVSALEAQAGPRTQAPQLPQGPEQQLAAFQAQLAPAAQAPQLLRRLHAHAREAGLNFERGEYRPVNEGTTGLVGYQLTLPVRGTYPQVRRFLDRAMEDLPGLALDGISFERENAGAALEAQLRFTLFLRKSP